MYNVWMFDEINATSFVIRGPVRHAGWLEKFYEIFERRKLDTRYGSSLINQWDTIRVFIAFVEGQVFLIDCLWFVSFGFANRLNNLLRSLDDWPTAELNNIKDQIALFDLQLDGIYGTSPTKKAAKAHNTEDFSKTFRSNEFTK